MASITSIRKLLILASLFLGPISIVYLSGNMNQFWRMSRVPRERESLTRRVGVLRKQPHGKLDDVREKATLQPLKAKSAEELVFDPGEDLIAKDLYKKVRVFCWIMTNPNNHKTKAVEVKATWAKRCNKYIFISSKADPFLPAINVNVSEGRQHLWGKTKAAFKYLYDNELNNFDFFMKADDDTFVVLENLRYMLRNVDPNEPRLYGARFKPFVKQGYMSGGAGYVISRGGLKAIMSKGFANIPNCRKDGRGIEDVEFGRCAEGAGVIAQDSRDSLGRERFHPLAPDDHLNPMPKGVWLWSYSYYKLKTGPECCSDTSISFHYIPPNDMKLLEYFIYRLHPHGVFRRVTEQRSSGEGAAVRREAARDRQLAKALIAKAHSMLAKAAKAKAEAALVVWEATKEADHVRREALKKAASKLGTVPPRSQN